MKKMLLALAATAAVGFSAPVLAQSVDQRAHNQEQRIQQGARNGTLTRREAYRLQRHEAILRATEARMRSRNGGHLTPQQRWRLTRMDQRNSATIHRLKHNRYHD